MSKSIFSAAHFNDEAAAYAYVEARIWPDGRVCPHCGVLERSAPLKGKSNRPGLYKCYACRKPFTVKIGTIFEASHIAMRDWLVAIHLICSSKKGISANQLHRTMGITLKSAWFMAHRIREAMAPANPPPLLGGPDKVVEADEMYLSKSPKTKTRGSYRSAPAVLTLVERGGPVRSMRLHGEPTKEKIRDALYDHVHHKSILHTDGAKHYGPTLAVSGHESVDHDKEFVRKGRTKHKVHTNSAEGYISVFKRGMIGVYQHCEEQHLHRYLAEFDFRQSTRTAMGIDDAGRATLTLKGTKGKRLTYRTTRGHEARA